MVEYFCLNKIRNKSNQIMTYVLGNNNGTTHYLDVDELKMAIKQKQIRVTNLQLSKDERLIDKKKKTTNKQSYTELTYQFLRPINMIKSISFRSNVPNVAKEIAKYKLFKPDCNITVSEDKHLYAIEQESSILVLSDV